MQESRRRSRAPVALLLIDVINHFEFEDGDAILKQALKMRHRLARLKARAREQNIPTIYVNDNFGQWQSQQSQMLEYCLRPEAKGRQFVELLQPDENDYFVLKPMHSAFFQSPLDLLRRHFGVSTLILSGLLTNSCILCTAHDGKMRDLDIYVAEDCCSARTRREHLQALQHIQTMASGKVVPSQKINLASLKRGPASRTPKFNHHRYLTL
jgi:nicotinamidase-related amidase